MYSRSEYFLVSDNFKYVVKIALLKLLCKTRELMKTVFVYWLTRKKLFFESLLNRPLSTVHCIILNWIVKQVSCNTVKIKKILIYWIGFERNFRFPYLNFKIQIGTVRYSLKRNKGNCPLCRKNPSLKDWNMISCQKSFPVWIECQGKTFFFKLKEHLVHNLYSFHFQSRNFVTILKIDNPLRT